MGSILTISIPTYNRKNELERSINILLPQLSDQVNLLILDNASDYNIFEVYNEISENFKKFIKVKRNKNNIGMCSNIVKCFEETESEWMWLLGDDDIPSENSVKTILEDINKIEEKIVLMKYSSIISQEKENKIILGLENLIDFLYETNPEKRYGNLLFISTSVYNVKKIKQMKNYMLYGYQFSNSYMPHNIILFFYLELNRGEGVQFLRTNIIELGKERDTYSDLIVGLGSIYGTKTLFLDIDKKREIKLRRLFTLFTSSIKGNFIELYLKGYLENKIKNYKKVYYDLYKESKYKYLVKDKVMFYILYFIIDKPFFIKLLSKLNKKFKSAIERKNKGIYHRI
ncbi:glycosyltransferase [Fusobacterium varium]|uniref:glycosyltransferase family 2 protein n=1 Tax=Fusobacterium TaxID=848 RepID=UPI0010315039|nr:glycosyltransferase family 2 protein [Fusobacterium ulcerans]